MLCVSETLLTTGSVQAETLQSSSTDTIRVGKTKLSYIVGLEETLLTAGSVQAETLQCSSNDTIQAENSQLRAEVQQLQERIGELEAETLASSQCAGSPLLMQQIEKLLH